MEHTEYVDLGRFETYIHYHFKDKHLLLEALSHSSYANEKHKTRNSNERLEFLGDSVLSIVVSEFLFHKYPDFLRASTWQIQWNGHRYQSPPCKHCL